MPQINLNLPPKVGELSSKTCSEICQGPMSAGQVTLLIGDFPGWDSPANKEIIKTFSFGNFYETMAFVNALALVVGTQQLYGVLEGAWVGEQRRNVLEKHAGPGKIRDVADVILQPGQLCAARGVVAIALCRGRLRRSRGRHGRCRGRRRCGSGNRRSGAARKNKRRAG